jgi:hypothetical protein
MRKGDIEMTNDECISTPNKLNQLNKLNDHKNLGQKPGGTREP